MPYLFQFFREASTLSVALVELKKVNAYQWQSLLGQCAQLVYVPDPDFVAVLPPARPATRPAARSQVSSTRRPDVEDAHSKGYVLDEAGDYTLLRLDNKRTGKSKYVLARDTGRGGWDSHVVPSEAAGRAELRRKAGAA